MSNANLVGKNTDTKVKYITSEFNSMPQIYGNWGELVKRLKKVLVDGGDKYKVLAVEVDNDNKILTIKPEQNFYTENMVIKLEGISDDINGEYRVLQRVHVDGVIKVHYKPGVETISEPITVTEESKIFLAPLGWDIIYDDIQNTGTAQFKNKSTVAPGVLKVIDHQPPNGYGKNWTKFARIVFGQNPDGQGGFVNNEKCPKRSDFPDSELTGNGVSGSSGTHGWSKWIYSSKTGSGITYNSEDSHNNKPWAIIGDDKTFYLFIAATASNYTIYSFGNYTPNLENDPYALILHVDLDWSQNNQYITNSSTQYGSFNNKFTCVNNHNYGPHGLVHRTSLGYHLGYSYIYHFGLLPPSDSNSPINGTNGYYATGSHKINTVSPSSGKMLTSPIYFTDSLNDYRGSLRGIEQPYGGGVVLESGTLVGKDKIAMAVDLHQTTGKTFYLFSLKDWE